MEDFFAAGGIGAVLRELKPLLNLDCMTVTGETLRERLAAEEGDYVDRRVIKSAAEPLEPQGGLVALFGSLAPDGAIIKRSAATPSLFEKTGARGGVLLARRSRRAHRRSQARRHGRRFPDPAERRARAAPSAMPEAGFLPIPKKLLEAGVKDMVRMSDARMSGTAYGTIILHIAPEAAVGGPLALVRTGDKIRLSVKERTLDLLVDEAELAKRRAARSKPPAAARARARLRQAVPRDRDAGAGRLRFRVSGAVGSSPSRGEGDPRAWPRMVTDERLKVLLHARRARGVAGAGGAVSRRRRAPASRSISRRPTALLARIAAGEAADVAILTRAAVDDLAAEGVLRADSVADVAVSLVGIAVKAGAARPDISSSRRSRRRCCRPNRSPIRDRRQRGVLRRADPAPRHRRGA